MIESWLKYLELLQAAIARMALNSFAMKGWSVALGAAIIGLTAKDDSPQLACFALLPALAFWYLDTYYLTLEYLFRQRYLGAMVQASAAVATVAAPPGAAAAGPVAPDFDMQPGAVTRLLFLGKISKSLAVRLIHLPIVLVALLTTAVGLSRIMSAHPAPVPASMLSVPNSDAAISIVRKPLPPTVITGVDAVELVKGADQNALREGVWHVRVAVRRPGRAKAKARDYKASAFARRRRLDAVLWVLLQSLSVIRDGSVRTF